MFRAASRPLLHCECGCARRVASPRIFGRGSQGAGTDAAAWAGRKSETAARRACLQGVWGVWQASPPRWKRLEPFHLAYAEHREDACCQKNEMWLQFRMHLLAAYGVRFHASGKPERQPGEVVAEARSLTAARAAMGKPPPANGGGHVWG